MATKDKLIGSDATLFRSTAIGAALNSGVMLAGSFYRIATISGTAIFPTGYAIGDIVVGDAGKTLNAGNTAQLLTMTEMLDINEFSFSFKAAEIDVTVLSDAASKYRKGKTDISGSIKGINTISVMKTTGSALNRFMRIVNLSATYSGALSAVDGSDLIGVFYLQKDASTTGETAAYMVAQIELYGYNLGAAVANAQSFDSGIRLIGPDPIVYFRPN